MVSRLWLFALLASCSFDAPSSPTRAFGAPCAVDTDCQSNLCGDAKTCVSCRTRVDCGKDEVCGATGACGPDTPNHNTVRGHSIEGGVVQSDPTGRRHVGRVAMIPVTQGGRR